MRGYNKVMLLGHTGRDPELRMTSGGTPVANFSLATQGYTKKDGEEAPVEWHRIVVFGRGAEICQQYLHKGDAIFIEGRLQARKWLDKDGVQRNTTEIIVDRFNFVNTKRGGLDTVEPYVEAEVVAEA